MTDVYTDVYTVIIIPRKRPLRAKIFRNGGSQAVRLPKECRFIDQNEVLARREGRRVILEPVDEWSDAFRSCLGAWSGELARLEQDDLRDPFV